MGPRKRGRVSWSRLRVMMEERERERGKVAYGAAGAGVEPDGERAVDVDLLEWC
jgi:hypothetical protein